MPVVGSTATPRGLLPTVIVAVTPGEPAEAGAATARGMAAAAASAVTPSPARFIHPPDLRLSAIRTADRTRIPAPPVLSPAAGTPHTATDITAGDRPATGCADARAHKVGGGSRRPTHIGRLAYPYLDGAHTHIWMAVATSGQA